MGGQIRCFFRFFSAIDFRAPFLAFLLRRKFFDEDLFNTEKVITSRGIQKRFIEATKRRKESAITHYNLINVNNEVVNVSNNSVSVNAMQHNVSNSTQSKVNESKLNKSKLKDTDYPFELFWNMYDKKTGKEKCQKKYEKLNEKTRELIFEHVLKYIEAQPNKQYRKNPESYLNQKAWNDEIISNDQTTGQTFAQQQMIRQSTKGVSTREQVIEASKHDNTTLEDLP